MSEIPMTSEGVAAAEDRVISRHEGVALWRQIAASLRRDIGNGRYPPASRLPTEAQLSQHFGVNRHTVRRAIEELSRAGLVRVEQGRGSFVAEDVIEYAVEPRTRFSEWIKRHNKEPSGRVLQLKETAADAEVARGLGIRTGGRVVLFERLGMANERPVSLTRHYFPAVRFRGLLERLRRGLGISAALHESGVPDYLRQMTRVTARMPSADEAELLRTPRSRPLLRAEHVNVDRSGAIVEFAIGLYPTPRVQIVFEP
ncbi:MAG: phosphonate metabolism transcriptional regulator PhnF [Alphaproteobacteria bacterium]|nr:phosphonate metabolism transcriptional regulator PhnF [Alphaproteobacteria bacterium]